MRAAPINEVNKIKVPEYAGPVHMPGPNVSHDTTPPLNWGVGGLSREAVTENRKKETLNSFSFSSEPVHAP